ncbi:glycoside hydrolase family 15 protein [Cellulomonas shaoxiangyii]|uniref:Glycoside hydrolase family 15 protein n=1 Tax=Cellulomonas shaoxiangyii TaxID=2566013 RepID=A0A4V1CMM9_9CELL|nr:glycoside hydrolase family 15 protein [Cellulomonas shaoxiangyii]QCB93505.1 glycoside hydrolase family 15 protein [Cellulomonas shaoxiangyii]TGY86827.1 glycoside hydrolase family 15 protein [Cellulomonas shaoxiangyii]
MTTPPAPARLLPGQSPIGDYAVIGDGHTAALVSLHGSVDWLCLPRFDSDACFAALLGTPDHGRWLLTVPDATEVTRRWRGDSFVLETTYRSPSGTAVVTDAMPLGDGRADLVRRVVCTQGEVVVAHEWTVRLGYGSVEPWVRHERDPEGNDTIRALAGPDSLVLRGDRLPHAVDRHHRDEVVLAAGEHLELALTWIPSWAEVPPRLTIEDRVDSTAIAWGLWARDCAYAGPYREAVVRSLLVLRMLTDATTGGIVAAATTSLPESPGGARNWDYRFCWLRDAALTLEALIEQGFREEATEWRDWLMRAVAGDPRDLQIMYRLDGSRRLPELTLDHLPGYAGSRPVRVGNAAVGQVQHDVLGEVMSALATARVAGLAETDDSWSLQCHLVEALVADWREPDRGIWEVRGEPRHFTHSKVMAWAAVDRAVRAAETHGLDAPLERWRATRDEIHAEVLEHGWSAELGTFVQHYGARHTDASLLQLPQVGFLPAQDPRVLATIAAVRAELEVAPGLVLRYRTDRTDDGLAGAEAPFLACSFWLADALARADDLAGATAVLDALVPLGGELGLLAEQYDPATGRMLGNVPQALSHLALVRAAHSHDLAQRRAAGRRAEPATAGREDAT